MKPILLFTLVLFSICCHAQVGTRNYLDQNGYKGIHVGEPISKFQQGRLHKIDTAVSDGSLTYYRYDDPDLLRPNSNTWFKSATIGFDHEGKFFELWLVYDKQDAKKIKTDFDLAFGAAFKIEGGNGYEYQGHRCTLNIFDKHYDGRYVVLFTVPDE